MVRLLSITKLITALSAQDAVGAVGNEVQHAEASSFYVAFGGGTSAGAVVIEGAHDPTYTGTWAVLATLTWAAANRVHNAAIAGNHIALRARISVAIVGGTVDVWSIITG